MPKKSLAGTQEVTDAELKNIDAILVLDKSGSMGEASMRLKGKTKWEEMREQVGSIAREMAKFDDDGLTLVVFSAHAQTIDGVLPDAVNRVFTESQPKGGTNLTEALEAAVAKARSSKKESVIVVFTDGSPNEPSSAIDVVNKAGMEFGRPKIGFAFIQIGQDSGAAAFLDKLDDEMKVDVTASITEEQAEELNVKQVFWLARNQ